MPQFPGSSSSISLEGSPPPGLDDDMDYDSDVSEDEHAIAEDGDEDDEDEIIGDVVEEDEEFEVEINTLTGNIFSVMIHPSDTVEVLKTRIAFKEGISPADQSLLHEQGALIISLSNGNSTMEELNIDRHSKLTLVTNTAAGASYKEAPPHNLAPTIKKNYQNFNTQLQNNPHTHHQQHNQFQSSLSSCSSVSSLRLPKIESASLQSLFNKDRAVQERAADEIAEAVDKIDMDSTRNTAAAAAEQVTSNSPKEIMKKPTRYQQRNNEQLSQKASSLNEKDGNMLIVNGDDGTVLIIQGVCGDGEFRDISLEFKILNGDDRSKHYTQDFNNSLGRKFDIEFHNGRIPPGGMQGYINSLRSNKSSDNLLNSYNRKYKNSKIQEKIKENAVTLEKMREIRNLLANQKIQYNRNRKFGNSGTRGHVVDVEELFQSPPPQQPPRPPAPLKTLEFPKIMRNCEMSGSFGTLYTDFNYETKENDKRESRSLPHKKSSNNVSSGVTRTRSINSSKTSLNRLIAEIYLQSKRKGQANLLPGQLPYTEQQLLKYAQLKIAILLNDQRGATTEPCQRCQLRRSTNTAANSDKEETCAYLLPTVVKNQWIGDGRGMPKSLDEEEKEVRSFEPFNNTNCTRRKSVMLPVDAERCMPLSSSVGSTHGHDAKNANDFGDRNTNSKGEGDAKSTLKQQQQRHFNDKKCKCILLPQQATASIRRHSLPTAKNANQVDSPSSTAQTRKSRLCEPDSTSVPVIKKSSVVKCQKCKKKIGIACRYQCRCGLTFCSTHRYPEAHDCNFDYKKEGQNKIRENNPVITAPKIQKI